MHLTGPKLGLNLRTTGAAHVTLYRTWLDTWSYLSNGLLVYVRLSDGGVADVVMFTGGET